jgi:hypothetical protein
MRAKGETYADRVNDLLPTLYVKIESLNEQLMIVEGRMADDIHYELLKATLLLAIADHAHGKWNLV